MLLPPAAWPALDAGGIPPVISEQQAIQRALNSIETDKHTVTVTNPRHRVLFDRKGVQFTPRRGPAWQWRLTRINNMRQPVVSPAHSASGVVDYSRGGLIERYLIKAETIEQRFVLEQPWPQGRDLVISGAIRSKGRMTPTDDGWVWRDDTGVVTLGRVTVFDATGRVLPASMAVTATRSTITLAAADLEGAVYPVTIDPEIGSNDFRISDMGMDGNGAFGAFTPAVAYNELANEYLVVWSGDDNTAPLVDGEFEIFGQLVDAATGADVGTNDFRISEMGVDGDTTFGAHSPAVVWNSAANEYLVVWEGDDDTGALVDGEFEIYGQRIDAVTGAEVGANDFRISDMGADGDAGFTALNPAVTWNAATNEYLVVWEGEDDTAPLVDNEREIFAQRLDAMGVEVGTSDFRLSDMGPDGNTAFGAFTPAVAWNARNNEFLVAWYGDDNTGTLVDNEFEIFCQRLDAAGSEFGNNDIRLSDMGQDGDVNFAAFRPAVVWNDFANEYLVVWEGDDDTGALVDDEFEIYGQRFDAVTGTQAGINDFRISDMGPDGDAAFIAFNPAVSWNARSDEFLVVWEGEDDTAPLVDNEREIFGQFLDAAGNEIDTNDFRLSDMGPDGDTTFDAFAPAVVWNARDNESLVVWHGDDDTGALVDGENEIFGQFFSSITASGGGGGCVLNQAYDRFDPVFLLLILFASGYLLRKHTGRLRR
jgi:hypothetical protein